MQHYFRPPVAFILRALLAVTGFTSHHWSENLLLASLHESRVGGSYSIKSSIMTGSMVAYLETLFHSSSM